MNKNEGLLLLIFAAECGAMGYYMATGDMLPARLGLAFLAGFSAHAAVRQP